MLQKLLRGGVVLIVADHGKRDFNVGSTSLPGGNQVDGLPPARVFDIIFEKCIQEAPT